MTQMKPLSIRKACYENLTCLKGQLTEKNTTNYSYSDIITMLINYYEEHQSDIENKVEKIMDTWLVNKVMLQNDFKSELTAMKYDIIDIIKGEMK